MKDKHIVSTDVLEAMGSVLTNKYAEGMPPMICDTEDWEYLVFDDDMEYKSRRYYNGCHIIDRIETLACNRFKHYLELITM